MRRFSLRPRGDSLMLVAGLRLATRGCLRKVDLTALKSTPRSFGWTRNMADSSKAAAAARQSRVIKTEKQLKKEAQKNAKLAKYNEKMAKQKVQTAGETSKEKEKKTAVKKAMVTCTYDIPTPPGDKKDVTIPLPAAYSPPFVEAAWYPWWEKQGFFKPEYGRKSVSDPNTKGSFIITLPPPNVTGTLHLGHALTNAIEDSVVRWHRMKGRTVVWVPGSDHAGIATQVVVEKKLMRERGLSRHDIGREKFMEEVWKWKQEKGDRIYHQLRKSGCSLDWSRTFFTMDENLSQAVKECFVRLHSEGVIYRSNRLVNWSTRLKSAISDIEVNKVELDGRTLLSVPGYDKKIEFGQLVSFAYRLENSNEEIVVATTRIETMLGDTAIAVHPDDVKYKAMVGKFCVHPFCDRRLPIIADDFVEMNFGTGAVKITPAHDHNDYDCGKRNNLEFIEMMNDEGFIADICPQFQGMKRFDARTAVLDALKEKRLYRETKDHAMVVPVCSRSKDIVEPLIKPQWWLNCTDMAKEATEAVKSGVLKLIPSSHDRIWYHWLENSRDWCISRQLWWGHRIPAYFVTFTDPNLPCGDPKEGKFWVSASSEDVAMEKAVEKFNVSEDKIVLKQDEDVLDTWFSSGLLPFSIFGWPNETEDLKAFYPNSLLETGHDILFFWVARMVFFGQKIMGQVPFSEVYLHAMVRDAHGRKMSKSLGNVIDPLDVMGGISLQELQKKLEGGNLDPQEVERAKAGQKADYPDGIPECGTDAMRFALCAYTAQGRDINLDVKRVVGYRHFCNKIWNAMRFSLGHLGSEFKPNPTQELTGKETVMDRWILSRLSVAVDDCNRGFKEYDFPLVTSAIYNFWVYELCDVYIESLKPTFYGNDEEAKTVARNVLYTCLDTALLLISPFMPFLSEELYQRLPCRSPCRSPSPPPSSICVTPYPEEYKYHDSALDTRVKLMQEVVRVIRSMKQDYLPAKAKPEVYLVCHTTDASDILTQFVGVVTTLSQCSKVHVLMGEEVVPGGCTMTTVGSSCQIHLQLRGLVDIVREVTKLEERIGKIDSQLEKLKKQEQVDGYEEKVPIEVRDATREKIQSLGTERGQLEGALTGFRSMKE